MFFHLIWIKEKNWKQYELNFLIRWWDENFIRDFLAHRWVVIVSLTEYKDNVEDFWNITMSVMYNNTEVQFLMPWEDLTERLYFVAYLWLAPQIVNFVDKPIPEVQMADLIKSTFLRIKEENEKIKQKKQEEIVKEQKKYEEASIKDALKIVNTNIDRIQQVMKSWEWVLSASEMKQLEDYSNEMKKIRLGTNFNKMASLVLDSHRLVSHAEEKIFKAYDNQKFLIDNNSSITNIDVIHENFNFNRISEKALFQPSGLTTTESIYNILKSSTVFLRLLRRDIVSTFQGTNFEEFFSTTLKLIEYIVLTCIIVISLVWLFSPILWVTRFSLYLLPAFWRLWLLMYLLNSLINTVKFNENPTTNNCIKVILFCVFAIIYWLWLRLLLHTFAL